MMTRPTLSLVLPVLNEAALLNDLERELILFLARIGLSAEVIFVDSGSTDGSSDALKALVQKDTRFRLVALTRDFGHQAAISAGLDHARGHAVVVMDSDLQDPFEVIVEMVNLWKQGYDVVHARPRAPEGSTPLQRAASNFASKLTRLAMPTEVPLETGDFRLTSRRVVVAVRELRDAHRFVRGMVAWVGFRQAEVLYNRSPRKLGTSKVSPFGKVLIASQNLMSLSVLPLRFLSVLGLLLGAFSLLLGLWAMLARIVSAPTPGWASTFILLSFGTSVQLLLAGMMGEYLARIYEAVKARPTYLTADLVNLQARDTSELESAPVAELASFNSLVPAPITESPSTAGAANTVSVPTALGVPAFGAAQGMESTRTNKDADAGASAAQPARPTMVGVPAVSESSMPAPAVVDDAIPPPVVPSAPVVATAPAAPPAAPPAPPAPSGRALLDSVDIIEVGKQNEVKAPARSSVPPRKTPPPPTVSDKPLARPRHATVMGVAPPMSTPVTTSPPGAAAASIPAAPVAPVVATPAEPAAPVVTTPAEPPAVVAPAEPTEATASSAASQAQTDVHKAQTKPPPPMTIDVTEEVPEVQGSDTN